MPKGIKNKDFTPPPLVHCDFCRNSPPFKPQKWNQRTCHRCAASGSPDQSKSRWDDYSRSVNNLLRSLGVKSPLSGSQATFHKARGRPERFSSSPK